MRALSFLSLASNAMASKDSGKAVAQALKHNSVLTALDVSGNAPDPSNDGPGFAQELALGIKDMGAMTSLNLASNELSVEGAKIIAACLPKCT
jgi:hypothetical protein